jgi:di/tricarboxylate transporter
MKPEFIVLALILLGALYLFWTQRLRTDITALLVMLSLALPWPRPGGKWSAILSPQEAFSGFGSVAVIMVTAMFVFSAAMVRTGAAEMIGGRLFRACAHNELLLQIAVLFVAAAFSMFINETTIVLVFMPVVLGVCKERNLSPSRYLLCAAYGAALGGQWTLIGTRSNIIVSDLLRQRTGQGIGFFDFTPIAATVFVGCATYFFLVGRRFLPKAEVQSLEQELGKEYLTEVMVTPQSATVGLTLDQLDWAKRQDVTIVGVIREGERMPPNGWLKLHPGDALIMQGAVPMIGSLLKSPDFQFMEEVKIGEKTLRSLEFITVEALLSPNSRYWTYHAADQFWSRLWFQCAGHFSARADHPGATLGHATRVRRLSSLAWPQLKFRTTRAQSEPDSAQRNSTSRALFSLSCRHLYANLIRKVTEN